MKSKTLVLLSALLTVLCLLTPLSARANPALAITIKGKIIKADGSLAPDGLTVEATDITTEVKAEPVTTELRDDGDNYALTLIGPLLDETKWPKAGDVIELVVKDESGEILGKTSHPVTPEEDEEAFIALDFQLPGIQTDIEPSRILGDGESEAKITIQVTENGEPVEGDTLNVESSLEVDIPTPVEIEPGIYQTTYTAPVQIGIDTLTIYSQTLDKTIQREIQLIGPPANVIVDAPSSITADGRTSIVTATVTDEEGNLINNAEVSFQIVEGEGTIEPEGTPKGDGKYISTYTSPVLEEESSVIIQASSGEVSSETVSVDLVLEPPAQNSVIAIRGAVYYEDGMTFLPDGFVDITVKNLTKDIQDTVPNQKLNGYNYSVTFIAGLPGMPNIVAETDDEIEVTVIKNGETVEITSHMLTSEEVEAGNVQIDVTTPLKAETSTMAIRGAIYYEDGTAHAPYGLEVRVKNLTKDIQLSPVTSQKLNGHDYSVVFVGPALGIEPIATAGDEIEITLQKADGNPVDILEPAMPYILTNAEVVVGEAEIDLTADISAETMALSLTGKVFQANGEPVPAGYKVEVTNPSIGVSWTGKTSVGEYSLTLFGDDVFGGTVVSTGDTLEIRIFDPDGELRGLGVDTPTATEILAGRAVAPDIRFALYEFFPPSVQEFPETLVLDEVNGTFTGDFTISLEFEDTGLPVTNEEPSAEVTYGQVNDFTNNGDGSYTATYTVDGKKLPFNGNDEVNVIFTVEFRRGTPEEFTRTVKDDTRPTPVIDARVSYRDGRTEIVMSEFDGRKYSGYVAINAGGSVSFDGTRSFDNVRIAEYRWNFSWIEEEIPEETKEEFTKVLEEEGIELSEEKEEELINTMQDISPLVADAVLEELERQGILEQLGVEGYVSSNRLQQSNSNTELCKLVNQIINNIELDEFSAADIMDLLPYVIPKIFSYASPLFPGLSANEIVTEISNMAATNTEQLVSIATKITVDIISDCINNPRQQMRVYNRATNNGEMSPDAVTREYIFPEPGVYIVELDVIDVAGNDNRNSEKATFTILVDQLELGGITVDSRHYQQLLDDIVYKLTKELIEDYNLPVQNLFRFVRSNPSYRSLLLDMLPPGLPIPAKDAVDLFFNEDIQPSPNVALGNFGNPIMPAPITDLPYPLDPSKGIPPTLAGDNLSLYLQVPNRDAAEVEFNLNGTSVSAERYAEDSVLHRFMLEEEQALLLLPSWPGKGGDELSPSVFSNVYLYYAPAPVGSGPLPDIPPTAPYDNACIEKFGANCPDFSDYKEVTMHMERDSNGKVIWVANEEIDAGNYYFYFFKVEIEEPIEFTIPATIEIPDAEIPSMDEPIEIEIDSWTMPDPRNLQITDRGLMEFMVTENLKNEVQKILEPVIKAIAENRPIPNLDITQEQMTAIQNILMEKARLLGNYLYQSNDPLLVSRFLFPAPKPVEDTNAQFSLWVGNFELSNLSDGAYDITAVVRDANGNILDELSPKKIKIDRNSVATTLSVAEGENAASYTYEDESGEQVLVTTVGAEDSTTLLNLTAGGILSDYLGVGFQILEYPSGRIWNPVIASTEYGLLIDENIKSLLIDQGITSDQISLAQSLLNSIPVVLVPQNQSVNSVSIDMLVNPYYSSKTTRQFWLRSIAIDKALNLGSSNVPIRLDVASRETDKAIVSSDKDIIFPDTEKVTLTVEFSERTVHPVDVVLQYKAGEADWTNISETISLGRDEGTDGWSQEVEWMPDFDELFATAKDEKQFKVRAVATNALEITDPEPEETTILLRFRPEIIALEAKATEFSVDSGAPKGMVELTTYTPALELIEPGISDIQFEISSDNGETWEVLEVVSTPEEVDAAQVAIIQTLIEKIVEGELESAQLADSYTKWMFSYDTTQVDDTITKDDGDARDYKLDENPYLIRSIVPDKGMEEVVIGESLSVDSQTVVVTPDQAIAVSVDNVDDIGPVAGTEIVSITDPVGIVEPVDGKYILGGLVKEDMEEYPVTISVKPAADADTFDQIKLFINGEETEYVFEKTDAGYVLTIDTTEFDNGDYVFEALAIDEEGNIEEPEVDRNSYDIAIANFEPAPEDEFRTQSTVKSKVGEFSLAEAEKPFPASELLVFSLYLPGVEPEEVDLLYELVEEYSMESSGQVLAMRTQQAPVATAYESAKDNGLLTVTQDGDILILEFDTTRVVDGLYNFDVLVTKRNGEYTASLLPVAIDNTEPEVTIVAPQDGIEVSSLPTIVITYSDTGIKIPTPDGVSIDVMSLPDRTSVDFEAEIKEEITVCRFNNPLKPGAYQVNVTVNDAAQNENTATSRFTVGDKAEPLSVTVVKPLPGEQVGPQPTIYAVYSGHAVEVEDVVFMLDGEDRTADATIVKGELTFVPDEPLDEGTHELTVTITNEYDAKAEATRTFEVVVEKDIYAPLILSTSPQGTLKSANVNISAIVIDERITEESGVATVTVSIDGGNAQEMELDGTNATLDVTLDDGTHTAKVTAEDNSGNQSSTSWSFTVDLDTTPPTISSVSPQGVVTTEDITLSVAFSDESGIDSAEVSIDGGSANAMTLNNNSATYEETGLDEGVHTAEVTVTDASANENEATYSWSFTVDLDTTPPTISSVSPQGVVTTEDVTLSVAFSDESGIDSAEVSIDGGSANAMTLNNNSATYEETGLDEGVHTAEVTVTDASANENEATYSWSFTVDLDTTPPTVTSTSPVGLIREARPIIAVTVNDESGIDEVEVDIEGPVNIRNEDMELSGTSATYDVDTDLEEGTYNVTVTATDGSANQNEAEAQWSFTVEFDTEPPEVNIVSPSPGTRITDQTPKIVANYSDKSEIDLDSVNLTVTDQNGNAITGGTLEKDQSKVSYTITEPLGYGEYTVELEVADIYENTANVEWSFFVESIDTGIETARNFPNPFTIDNGGTTIAFVITKQARVTVKIYDMTSRLVAIPIQDRMMNAGSQNVKWDALSDNGDKLAKGVYFCQIIADGGQKQEQTVIKMALFR